jgi:circadian clock protein KaiB
MEEAKKKTATEEFEEALVHSKSEKYVLRLYITGMTPRSTRAIESIRKLCEEKLTGRYELEIIDIYQNPNLLQGEQILAAPTLIKKLPLPLRRLVGDLSDTERVLVGLDLRQNMIHPDSKDSLSREELLIRLEEAEETLRAIRSGEVDALVVSGSQGEPDAPFTVVIPERKFDDN